MNEPLPVTRAYLLVSRLSVTSSYIRVSVTTLFLYKFTDISW